MVARPSRHAGHRRRQGRLEPRQLQGPRARQPRAARRRRRAPAFAKLCGLLRYVDGDYKDPATFEALKASARRRPAAGRTTWPSRRRCSARSSSSLGASRAAPRSARVIVEKPFGRDLASAQELERDPASVISPSRRSSGSTTTSARRRSRTSSTSGSPTPSSSRSGTATTSTACRSPWPRTSASASAAASTRGRRDPRRGPEPPAPGRRPAGDGAARVPRLRGDRDEKAERLPGHPAARRRDDVVRGQYEGYRAEKGVAPDSDVETFGALRLQIDTWRWAGVPFYIRAGKCLPATAPRCWCSCRPPPQALFDDSQPRDGRANYVRFSCSRRRPWRSGARQAAGRGLRRRAARALPVRGRARARARPTSACSATRWPATARSSRARTRSRRHGRRRSDPRRHAARAAVCPRHAGARARPTR